MFEKVIVATDVRVSVDEQGRLWSTHATLSDSFLQKFRPLARELVLVARVDASRPRSGRLRESLRLVPLPEIGRSGRYRALYGFMKTLYSIKPTPADLVFLRIPELVSLALGLRSLASPATTVSNVVAESNAWITGASNLHSVKRHAFDLLIRKIVARSDAAVYVTREALQRRYPTSRPTLSMSNVVMPDGWDDIMPDDLQGQELARNDGAITQIITVAHMNGNVKGVDTVIEAMAGLREQGCAGISLTVVGPGDPARLLLQAAELGLAGRVTFTGPIYDHSELRRLLLNADLFVLASRSEGLPRAMIEAMALQVPAIGSRVGGITELVGLEWSFAAGDSRQLGLLIQAASSAEARSAMRRSQLPVARQVIASAQPHTLATFLTNLRCGTETHLA